MPPRAAITCDRTLRVRFAFSAAPADRAGLHAVQPFVAQRFQRRTRSRLRRFEFGREVRVGEPRQDLGAILGRGTPDRFARGRMSAAPAIGGIATAAWTLRRRGGAAQFVRDVDTRRLRPVETQRHPAPESYRARVDTRVDTNVTQRGVSGGPLRFGASEADCLISR